MKIYQPSDEQETQWDEWIGTRPENVARVARDFNPWTLYEFKETGQKVTLLSFGEKADGSVVLTVRVSKEHNLACLLERDVFGVSPDNLQVAAHPPWPTP